MDKIKYFLSKNKIEFCENFDVSTLSSIKIGERVKIAIFPKNVVQLKLVIAMLYAKKYILR